uniref:PO21 protein n=1 Tax=Fopius arisanus TaxID=64838 RepID=A0A0C9QX33_9HYME
MTEQFSDSRPRREVGSDILPAQDRAPLSLLQQLTGRAKHHRDSKTNCQTVSSRGNLTDNHIQYKQNESGVPDSISIQSVGEHTRSLTNLNRNEADASVIPPTASEMIQCPHCDRAFKTKQGLGVHRARSHPQENNEQIVIERTKARWNPEHLRMLAAAEARAPPTVRFMNEYLFREAGTGRTLESLKKQRHSSAYRIMVQQFKDELGQPKRTAHEERNSVQLEGGPMSKDNTSPYQDQPQMTPIPIRDAPPPTQIDRLPMTESAPEADKHSQSHMELHLREDLAFLHNNASDISGGRALEKAVLEVLNGRDPEQSLVDWFHLQFPNAAHTTRLRRGRRGPVSNIQLSKRKQRQRDYRAIQVLWNKNMSKAASKILDGDADKVPHPSLKTQEKFWRPILEDKQELPSTSMDTWTIDDSLKDIFMPITTDEVIESKPDARSAAGPDGVSAGDWLRKVPERIKTIIFNAILYSGKIPPIWRDSRTILIPKENGTLDPAKFRPISISSVVLRHMHRVLSNRLLEKQLLDERQRAFIKADGLADNVFVLSTVINDARSRLRELHVAAIDVKKAFDTVSHGAIERVLQDKGFPPEFVKYIMTMYTSAVTVLEIDGERSSTIHPGQGVRQGDPLSSLIFNMVIDVIIKRIPGFYGYNLGGVQINALAFADDLVLLTESREGLQDVLDGVVRDLALHGLSPMPNKCLALSLVPSGKVKKIRTLSAKTFRIAGCYIPQIGVADTWKHLGVTFCHKGPAAARIDIEDPLMKITQAPLKPQQRLTMLKMFLLPRFTHSLVFGRSNSGMLRKLDRTVRKFVRNWLFLPTDVPLGFYHAPISDSGLGIMSFESAIPELLRRRLINLSCSDFSIARAIRNQDWVISRLKWCDQARVENSDWAKKLHASVDGWELREARNSTLSTSWLHDPFVTIPAREFIQNVRTRINALPSRVRTTRGTFRRQNESILCRAGCGETESTAHIIQRCMRTHGGRVLRHDAICGTVAKLLRAKGFEVHQEETYRTREGARKPDIIAVNDAGANIIDVQIVSGARPLQQAHNTKRQKYANNSDLLNSVSDRFQVIPASIRTSSVTISWRGIWCGESAEFLRYLGIPKSSLRGVTTRVLQGSHLNFNRFNAMTSVANHAQWPWRPRGTAND